MVLEKWLVNQDTGMFGTERMMGTKVINDALFWDQF